MWTFSNYRFRQLHTLRYWSLRFNCSIESVSRCGGWACSRHHMRFGDQGYFMGSDGYGPISRVPSRGRAHPSKWLSSHSDSSIAITFLCHCCKTQHWVGTSSKMIALHSAGTFPRHDEKHYALVGPGNPRVEEITMLETHSWATWRRAIREIRTLRARI